jgi:hypothetical protein
MTSPTPAAATPTTIEATRLTLTKDIHAKWNKFSEVDAAAFKSSDDLVTQVVSKYGIDKAVAQRDVDTLLKGRSF